jgi:Glycosyltransferase sugar-binding region containing DXD motif
MQARMYDVFAYWDGEDRSQISAFESEWKATYPAFRIFGNRDIYPLLEKYSPRHVDLFTSLRLPSAKSDVARLLLLYELGGLYIDCHFGLRSHNDLEAIFQKLEGGLELIVVDRDRSIAARPIGEYYFINGIIFARPSCSLLLMCAFQALANLECHRVFETLWGYTYYHVAMLSGPGMLTSMILDPKYLTRSLRTQIRPDYAAKIAVIPEETIPMVRNLHNYRLSGQHWSERQLSERLFET